MHVSSLTAGCIAHVFVNTLQKIARSDRRGQGLDRHGIGMCKGNKLPPKMVGLA